MVTILVDPVELAEINDDRSLPELILLDCRSLFELSLLDVRSLLALSLLELWLFEDIVVLIRTRESKNWTKSLKLRRMLGEQAWSNASGKSSRNFASLIGHYL